MNDMQMYDLTLILKDIRRSIGVADSDRDPQHKIGYMLSCLRFLEEYIKQFIENGTPSDICEIQNALDEKQKQSLYVYEKEKQRLTDLFGVKAALDEATKIR